jgi:hypothetical protein
VGIRETVHEQATWTYGEDYMVLKDCTHSEILRDMAEGIDFKLNWKVKEVAYSDRDSLVTVTSTNGEVITAERAIVCVPQNILKDQEVFETPPNFCCIFAFNSCPVFPSKSPQYAHGPETQNPNSRP